MICNFDLVRVEYRTPVPGTSHESSGTCERSLAAEGPQFTLPIRSPRTAARTPVIPLALLRPGLLLPSFREWGPPTSVMTRWAIVI